MKALSPERMAKYDEYAIRVWGIPSAVLMENAGRTTYRLAKERYLIPGSRLTVFCGRGNNGGDGFVIARYALRDGFSARAFLLCKTSDLKGDTALNMGLFESLGGVITEIDDASFPLAKASLKETDVIVDAIFGTGLSKPVSGFEGRIIELINHSGKTVIAVDIPSGVDGRTGVPLGTAVKATHTYTYGYPKLGQLFYPGAYHAGGLTVIDISLPPHGETVLGVDANIVDGELIRGFLKDRMPWAHKGTFGHVAVIAGSPGKTGAAYMASLAALKIGAGLVTLLIPQALNAVMEVKLTEVMTYPVADGGSGYFVLSSYDEILEFISDKDVVVMGPGLSQHEETQEIVRRLFAKTDKPFVIDADAINAFAGHTDLIAEAKRSAVFTPHPGELGRLMKLSPMEINADRMSVGKGFVEKTEMNLVLKGARTIIFDNQGEAFIIPPGNPALAKGGSGDILTGFIGGLLAQGYSMTEASILGAYLHGYAADNFVEESTDMDLLAGDLLVETGRVLREIKRGTDRVYIEKSL
ncbi:MAG: NAD(P)H-hydrate dehydratase [Syntrophobacterales bacterium]|jgi:NAD(P)H-hydrate epimerase|nr:NAD(P)H-hydrate dehydratase [Syntrophobacterales bacterium]